MTTYELVDEKRFKITFVTESVTKNGQSEIIRHGGLQWMLDLDEKSGTLLCTSQRREPWSADVKVMIRILDFEMGFGKKEPKTLFVTFDNNNGKLVWKSHCFLYFESSKLEVIIEILNASGLPNRRDFTVYDNKFSDMTLIVNGYKLFVNKGVLASVSPVFRAMFYTNFKEADDKQVGLIDVDYHDFLVLLRILHDKLPLITEYNIDDILKLADQFDIKIIMDECQNFLLIPDSIPLVDKIRLADKYQMKDIMPRLIESIEYVWEMENIDDVGCDTVKQLMNKAKMLKNIDVDTVSSISPSESTTSTASSASTLTARSWRTSTSSSWSDG